MANRKKVVLLTPVLAHYRHDLYKNLINSRDFDFEIIGGKEYWGIKSLEGDGYETFNFFSFAFFKHRFYYLKGSIRYILDVKPDIVISSGVDFHHIHTLLLFILFRLILRNDFYWWSQGTSGHQGKAGWFMRKIVYKMASGILVYSKTGKENLLLMGVKVDRISVVNNCLNVEDYGYLNQDIFKEKDEQKDFKILFSGRLIEKAKLNVLFQALGMLDEAGYKDIKCYIIGSGEEEKLRILAEELNIKNRIIFGGSKYGKDVHPYFLESDLYIYPGGIGLSILHAFSFGLPVITSNDYSLHFPEVELLTPGLNGDVYQEGKPSDLVGKILKWREKLSESKDEIKKNCINSIEKLGYLPEKVSSAILEHISNHKD